MRHKTEVRPHPQGTWYWVCSCGGRSWEWVDKRDAVNDASAHEAACDNPDTKENDDA